MRNLVVSSFIAVFAVAVGGLGAQTTGSTVYIPASAHLAGVAGTTWRTDLQVKARGTQQANFQIDLLQRNRDNSDPTSVSLTLEPGMSMRYEDVLSDLFDFNGTAGLRIRPTSGHITVTSRTYNDDPSGTYGQYIGSSGASEAFAEGEDVALIQLSRSVDAEAGYRTNIGFLNVTAVTIDVEVDLYLSTGVHLGRFGHRMLPYEYDQVTDIFGYVSPFDVEDGYALVRTTTSGGSFFTYASVVDNRSGDAIFMPGIGEPPDEPSRRIVLEAEPNFRDLGGYPGAGGGTVRWRTLFRSGDLHGLSPADVAAINELGIKLIIDLRTDEEIDRSPDAVIEGASRLVNTLAMDEFNDLLESVMVSGDTSPLTIEAVTAAYDRMYPDNTGPFGRLLTEIFAAKNRPVLVHCAGGKDRTGLAAALILAALGVDEVTIVEDYLLSGEYLAESYEDDLDALVAVFEARSSQAASAEDRRRLGYIIDVRTEYIAAAIQRIRDDYGSYQGYITEGLGISGAALVAFRSELLD